MSTLRKITIKEIGLTKQLLQKLMIEKNASVDIAKVYGIITNEETIETDYGVGHKLYGTIEAVNLLTGEVYESRCLILPKMVGNELAAMIQKSNMVKFAFIIGIAPNEKSVYEYVATELLNVEAKTIMNDLKAQLKALPPA